MPVNPDKCSELIRLPDQEDLYVEFKSDLRGLPDSELVEAVICLANAKGGDLYLGVEDDGTVSGVSAHHDDPDGLAALVGNRTEPRLVVAADRIVIDGQHVIRVRVPRSHGASSTSDGRFLQRRLRGDGSPECVPMTPNEVSRRTPILVEADPSLTPVLGATVDDISLIERERLRGILMRQPNADRALRSLGNDDLDAALKFTVPIDGRSVPTVLGLLLVGSPGAIARHLPSHESAIQIFRGTSLTMNSHARESILTTLERLNGVFAAQRDSEELTIGLQRVTLPNIDPYSFREVVVNAFAHRDYSQLGTVRVSWYPDALEISNPGGLVDGVSISNILTAPPTPRNFALADALKRLGLAERSGRGVDRIFEGQVRYGRLPPDYSGTTSSQVVVRLQRGPADYAFVAALAEYERRMGNRFPVSETIVIAALRRAGRLSTGELAVQLQISESRARIIADELVASDLVAPHGRTRAHFYTLSQNFLAVLGTPQALPKLVGLSDTEQETAILERMRAGQVITRATVSELCGLTVEQSKYRLKRMVERGLLRKAGNGPATYYLAVTISPEEYLDDR